MTGREYAVRYRWRDGHEHIAGGYTLHGARQHLQQAASKDSDPKAVEVLTRPWLPWQPLNQDQELLDRQTPEHAGTPTRTARAPGQTENDDQHA